MEAFFVRVMVAVMTNPKVEEILRALIRDETKQLVDTVDGLDGKMGNLQEQFTQIPGQVIGGVIDQLLARLPHLPWM